MFFKLIILCTLTFGCNQCAIVDNQAPTRPDLENFGLNGRIIDGEPAGPGQFPWQVAIDFLRGGRSQYCGGALISPEWVLTAAHCVYQGSSFSVRLGTLWSNYDNDEFDLQVIPGERAIHHPQYNPNTYNNDIGLIRLARKAFLNRYVQTIYLANSDDRLDPNTRVTVSGWGMTRDGGSASSVLRYVNLRTISNDQCRDFYNSEIIIHSTVCCRGNTIQSTCHGDDGGPLVRYTNYGPIHVGVASFVSSKGCEYGIPSGYVRTASFRYWIRQNTGV